MALSTTDLPTLYALLTNALSPDESLRKPAETTLSACENRPGFCSCLLEIIATKNLESQNNARWLASVYFKNSINRYWRNRRDSLGISSEEKPYLRKKLLELIREENHQIAVQLAVLVSKIARIDYPREWPELFPILIQQLQLADILTTQRVYMVLHRTLKELSTKRLTADQRTFAESMIDAVAICGPGFKAPTEGELSGYLLDDMVEDMRVDLEEIRREWIAKGCTIMTDGWTDRRNRTLLNFLVSCGGYTMFIKSIDASAHVKNATYLCEAIEEVIAEVGEENVIQVVTDNAANYVAAGKLLMERHPTIFWSPCAAHCIDLMLEEIGKLEFVKSCVERAKNICKFIYNHAFVLSTMRKYTGGKELARLGITRFASNFITLQSLLTSRDGLRSMFVGQEWISSSYATTTVGLDVADCIFDEDGFWKPAREILKITSQLFDYTWHHWRSDMQTILHEFSMFVQSPVGTVFSFECQQALQLTCERWLLCLKTLQRMLISGFQSDARSVQEVLPVKEVCPSLLQAVQSLLQYRSAFQQGHETLCAFADRACLKLMKVLVSVQCVHPYSFSNQHVLPSILEFCYKQITDPEPHIVSFESFLIQCMILFKSVLECKDYKSSNAGRVVGDVVITLEQAKNNIAREAEKIVQTLMVSDRVILLCNVLIRRYFIFSSKDLEEWARDPESFHHDQDMIQWTEKLRPCAEALYLTLFENYRQVLAPMVVDILKEAMGNCLATEVEITQQMLLKDAAYSAVGMTHYELSNYLSFKGWFEGALLPELHNTHSNRWIIRRRIAWLFGQWVSEIKDEIRKPVYCELLGLLQDKDLAVKLAACRSLCSLFEDVQFYEEDFMDYITGCLEICFHAMQDVQEFDSKVQILNLISVMIERLGGKIVPSANKLIQFFPQVWDESTGESLLRIQVILAIQNFVVALGPQSAMCYNMLLPILQQSTDVNNPDELNLLEDGVMLWETTLSNATSMVSQLLELFPNLVAIIEKSFDHLLVAMKIIEGYILIGGANFLNLHASGVAKIFDSVVANVNQKGLLSAMPIIEMLVQLFPRDAPPLLSGVLQKLVVFFISGGDDSDPTAAAIKASAGAILARLLVQNCNYFAHMITESSLSAMLQQAGIKLDQNLLLCLIDAWLDKVDNVTIIPRKAYALALCILLTSREPHILEKLDQIINVCTSILVVDIDNNGSEESSFDSMHSVENHEALQSVVGENKDSRKRQLKSSDPIKDTSLAHVMKENLQACAALHGEAPFNAAMSRVHPTVLGQLEHFLKT